MIEAEFILRRFETVFDRPAMSFDFRKPFDRCSARRPSGEKGEVAVDDFAPDQKSARPCLPGEGLVVFAAVEIGEFEIGPVMQPLALGSRACGKTPPCGGGQSVGDVLRWPGDGLRLAPGMERLVAFDTGTFAAMARSIMPCANAGLVAKPPEALSMISCGTCALAMRAGSSVQLLGRYNSRSMKA